MVVRFGQKHIALKNSKLKEVVLKDDKRQDRHGNSKMHTRPSGMILIILVSFISLWYQNLIRTYHIGNTKASTTKKEEEKKEHNVGSGKTIDFAWPSSSTNNGERRPVIAYITQGTAASCYVLEQRFQEKLTPSDSYVFVCHCYDEPPDDGTSSCIYQPKTSYAEGKNIIVKALLPEECSKWDQIKYVVSFDDDAHLFPIPYSGKRGDKSGHIPTREHFHDGWRSFHTMLLQNMTTYPFIKPQYMSDFDDTGTKYQTCADENFWVIRKDHLPVIYPHSTTANDLHWLNYVRVVYLLHKCYPQAFKVLHSYRTGNPTHRFDTKRYNFGNVTKLAVSMLREEYPILGPWDVDMYPWGHRCVVHEAPSIELHPKCQAAMEDRFQKWIDGTYLP